MPVLPFAIQRVLIAIPAAHISLQLPLTTPTLAGMFVKTGPRAKPQCQQLDIVVVMRKVEIKNSPASK